MLPRCTTNLNVPLYRIAGLSAARVLFDHFERVVVVEPDAIDVKEDPARSTRPRVMQWLGHHGKQLSSQTPSLLKP